MAKPETRFLDRSTPPTLFTLIVIAGSMAIAMNMFLPALPDIAEYFGAEYRVMQLSVALFMAMSGLLQIVTGPISDRFGRRPVLLAGFAIFVVATLGCLFAQSTEMFLFFRTVQAFIAVAMTLSRAVIRDMVPQAESASMIGYVTMFMAVVPMVSPFFGGFLDEMFGWKSVFWLLAGYGVLGFWLVWADLGETNTNKSSSFSAQFSAYPELLLSQRFWGYCLTAAFSSGAFFAYLGGAPFVGTVVFDLTPTALGFYFGAPAIGYMAGNFLSGRYSVRYGVNKMVLIGAVALIVGVTMSLVIFLIDAGNVQSFFGFMIFVGFGNGLVLPNATSGLLSVRPHLAGTASGLGGAIMIGGGGALSALAGALLGPKTGPFPLLYLMLTVSILSLICILLVIRREKRVGIA